MSGEGPQALEVVGIDGAPSLDFTAWDVQVTNQDDELVASHDILMPVLNRPGEGASGR